MRTKPLHKSSRRRALRTGLVLLNVLLVAMILAIVVVNPAQTHGTTQSTASAAASQTADAPVDQLASVNIAVTVATMTDLPESAAVINQADSEQITQTLASTNDTIVSKPQVVASAFVSNKNIHTYITQKGDSVESLAAQFGVTSDSIRWSNNLAVDSLLPGQKLYIPPVNGIVYIVRAGDTPNSLAAQYHTNAAQLIADNDAEINGLQPGERIIIPNGSIVAAVPTYAYASSGLAWGYGAIYGFNGYDFGECTWYVATQISVPANWGNADTWAAGARASGWNVSSTPTVGAIAQTPAGGLGHVAIVVAINGNQVEIRDMNNYGDGGGFDRVGEGWVPISLYPNYITR